MLHSIVQGALVAIPFGLIAIMIAVLSYICGYCVGFEHAKRMLKGGKK